MLFKVSINTAMKVYHGDYSSYPTTASLREQIIYLPADRNGLISPGFLKEYITAIQKITAAKKVEEEEFLMNTMKKLFPAENYC